MIEGDDPIVSDWFIIATVRIEHGTTVELYGPYGSDSEADYAGAILTEMPRVLRIVITQPSPFIGDTDE